ncbi:hypothetical protein CDAR_47791 [Caerostris darwini]|uniref:Uncharacterized protein n=1 Tax=Caerostris darwini TaxID=1538125 RepID=A0AAV4M9B4_9ARAC|nr:hypothetical protein CDAR_47791 [Caerostris darwini]
MLVKGKQSLWQFRDEVTAQPVASPPHPWVIRRSVALGDTQCYPRGRLALAPRRFSRKPGGTFMTASDCKTSHFEG